MKKDIHPEFHKDMTVTCACGATHTVSSTKEDLKIDICSACHPFYTGNEKTLDTAGRVDKFKKRMEAAAAKTPKKSKVKSAPADDDAKPEEKAPEAEKVEEALAENVVEDTTEEVKEATPTDV